jgi:hypothetical protein
MKRFVGGGNLNIELNRCKIGRAALARSTLGWKTSGQLVGMRSSEGVARHLPYIEKRPVGVKSSISKAQFNGEPVFVGEEFLAAGLGMDASRGTDLEHRAESHRTLLE